MAIARWKRGVGRGGRKLFRSASALGSAFIRRKLSANGRGTASKLRDRFKKPSGKKRKLKEPKMVGDDIHTGITFYTIKKRVNKRVKSVFKKSPNLKVHDQYSAIITVGEGVQANQSVTAAGTTYQAINTGASPGYATTGVSAIGVNPYQSITGGQYYSAGVVPANDRMLLKSVEIELRVKNLSSLQAYVELYLVKNKNDQAQPVVVNWGRVMLENALGKAIAGGAAGYDTPDTIGTLPNKTFGFKSMYKILRAHRLLLSAFSEEIVRFELDMNLMINLNKIISQNPSIDTSTATWTAANVAVPYTKGGIQIFARISGGVVKDDDTTATTGSPEVAFVISRMSNYKCVNANDRVGTQQGRSILTTGHAVTAQNIINIVDAIADVVNA